MERVNGLSYISRPFGLVQLGMHARIRNSTLFYNCEEKKEAVQAAPLEFYARLRQI